jgi:hypothetical protein
MSKEKEENTEKKLGFAVTPDGKLKIVKNFVLKTENRELTFMYLEDETVTINVKHFEESEEKPYTELITDQTMRLSKLTVALLMACIIKANDDFNLSLDSIISELNAKNNNERDS